MFVNPACQKTLLRPTGVEPATYGFEVRRSIQLSYGRLAYPVSKGKSPLTQMSAGISKGG